MKTPKMISAALLAAAMLGTGALAQSSGQAQSAPAPDTPTPSQFVYLAQVPSPAELKSRAAAQGVTVERIDQSQSGTIVVYKYPNGTTSTVAYASMPAGDEAAVAGTAPATQGVPVAQTSTVVYTPAPAYPYYSGYPYYGGYYPYYNGWWVAPLAIGLGLGYGWHGGWHGGWGGGFHGGFHR
jgi:hypothetical protein